MTAPARQVPQDGCGGTLLGTTLTRALRGTQPLDTIDSVSSLEMVSTWSPKGQEGLTWCASRASGTRS